VRPRWRLGTREEPGTLTQGAPVFPVPLHDTLRGRDLVSWEE
jgi:hypothetical protein